MEKKDWNMLVWIAVIFGILYFVPSQSEWFRTSIFSAFDLLLVLERRMEMVQHSEVIGGLGILDASENCSHTQD